MELRRLSWGDWLAGASGVLMIIALFLPWYSAGEESANAWQSMAFDDVILFTAAVLGIAAALAVGLPRFTDFSVATTSLALMPAAVGLVVTVWRLVAPAPPIDVSLEVGAWLGLLSAIGIIVGAWRGAKDEGPARRSAAAERKASEEALTRSELLSLNAPVQK